MAQWAVYPEDAQPSKPAVALADQIERDGGRAVIVEEAYMPRPETLDATEVTRRLRSLPGWELKDGTLHRGFVFPDFAEAFRFMTAVAAEAERLNHHPEWSNVYNRVTMNLVTHYAGGITALDFELAGRAQQLAGNAR